MGSAKVKAQEAISLIYANKDPKHWLGGKDPMLQQGLDTYITANKALGSKSGDD